MGPPVIPKTFPSLANHFTVAQVVVEHASDTNIQILTQTTFYENSLDLSSQMSAIKSVGMKYPLPRIDFSRCAYYCPLLRWK
jgi:hypothetical protein